MTLHRALRKAWSLALATAISLRLGRKRRDDLAFVEAAHQRVMRRPVDPDMQDRLLGLLAEGRPRRIVVEALLLQLFVERLHALRSRAVAQLPPAEVLVDLGGASPVHPGGVLMSMGYPHRPAEITIVDLPTTTDHTPVEERVWGQTKVRCLYRSMVDLSPLPDESVDGVWAGQSLEHVTLAEARQTVREVRRVLKPGGWFCLDTPNRDLTRRQSPHGWIHPQHQMEYTPAQLQELLTDAGLELVCLRGLALMPWTQRTGLFWPGEIRPDAPGSDSPSGCYIIFATTRKPAATETNT